MDAYELEQENEEIRASRHSTRRRLLALFVALFLLAITILAASYSLFKAPPHPERTRPLPPVIPKEGAIR